MQKQVSKIDFSGQHIYAGLDVHDKSWKVTIYVEKWFFKTFVQDPVPTLLANYLNRTFPGGIYHAAYEAGFSGFWTQKELVGLGVETIITNPADIPTTDKEKRQKEDKRDSKKIAKCLSNGDLEAIYVPSDTAVQDRLLVRMRYNIAKDVRRCQHRIKSFLLFYGIKIPQEFNTTQKHWTLKFLQWLKGIKMGCSSGNEALNMLISEFEIMKNESKKVNRLLIDLSKQPRFSENYRLLTSVPGVGMLTAMRFLTEIVEINRFGNLDKLASYVGLIPSTNSSGEKSRVGDITPRGHRALRTALIESAWKAIVKDPALMSKYYQLCKTMEGNKAIVRIAKKLLNRMAFVLRNKKAYELSKA